MRPITNSKEHLEKVNETYIEHGEFAIRWGFFLIWAGIISIIHGVLPFLFPFTVPILLKKVKNAADSRGHRDAS